MILSQTVKKTRRNRECWNCGCTIKKGQQYGNRVSRYDSKLLTTNYCLSEHCSEYALHDFSPQNQFNNFKKKK